jgi:serine/threonine protein kinase
MSTHDDTDMKLADFGFARRFSLSDPDRMKTKCGTPAFVPPELISGISYGPKCDIWSAGCTLFMLLSGRAPFVIDKKVKGAKNAMFYKIRAGDYVFYNNYWKHISLDARKLVLSMMQIDPRRRVSAKEALESDYWMNTPDEDLRRVSLEASLKEIISFHARRKLKGAIGAVMVAAGARFWDINTAAIWRDDLFDSDKAVDGDCEQCEHNRKNSNNDDEDGSPFPGTPPTFESLYQLEKVVEEGKHESYWEGKSLESNRSYTIKVVNRKDLSHADEGAVLNEVAVLKSLRHTHIVNLLDFFEEPGNFYLVLHRCSGGDVLDRVASLNQYSEKDARELSRGLLSAVEFMHDR